MTDREESNRNDPGPGASSRITGVRRPVSTPIQLPDLELVTADLITKFGLHSESAGISAESALSFGAAVESRTEHCLHDDGWLEAVEGLAQLLVVSEARLTGGPEAHETGNRNASRIGSQGGATSFELQMAEVVLRDHESAACADSIVNVRDFACAMLSARCQALVRDNATVVASGAECRIFADGHSHVIAEGGQIWGSDLATMDVSGGELYVNGETVVNASGDTKIFASGEAMIFVEGQSTIELRGNAVAFVNGTVKAAAYERARLVQLGGELSVDNSAWGGEVLAAGEPAAVELLARLGERQRRQGQIAGEIADVGQFWFDSDDPLARLSLTVWNTVGGGKIEQTINKYGDVNTRFELGHYRSIGFRGVQRPVVVKRYPDAPDLSVEDAGSIETEVVCDGAGRMTVRTDGRRVIEFDLDESGCPVDPQGRLVQTEFPLSLGGKVKCETRYSGREDGLEREITVRSANRIESEKTYVSGDGKRERVENEGLSEDGRRFRRITWPDGETGLSVQTLYEDGVVKTEFKMGPYRSITHVPDQETLAEKRYGTAPDISSGGIKVYATVDSLGRSRELFSDGRWITSFEGDPDRRLRLINYPFNDRQKRISRVEFSDNSKVDEGTASSLRSETFRVSEGGVERVREFDVTEGIEKEIVSFDQLGQVVHTQLVGADEYGRFVRREWSDDAFGLVLHTQYESGTVITTFQDHPSISSLVCEPHVEAVVKTADGSLRAALESELSMVLRTDLDGQGQLQEALGDGRSITHLADSVDGVLRITRYPPGDSLRRELLLEYRDRNVTRLDDSTEVAEFFPASGGKVMKSVKYPTGNPEGRVSDVFYFLGAVRDLKSESLYRHGNVSVREQEFERDEGVLKERSIYRDNKLAAVEREGVDERGTFNSRQLHAGDCGRVDQLFYRDGTVTTRFLDGGSPAPLSATFDEILLSPSGGAVAHRRHSVASEFESVPEEVVDSAFFKDVRPDGSAVLYFLDGRTDEVGPGASL